MRTKLLWIGADLAVTDPSVRGTFPAVDVQAESSLSAGLERLKAGAFEAIVLSVASLSCSGEEALAAAFRTAPGLPVIVHHRAGSIDDVIHLTRLGAFYVLLGDVDPDLFGAAVHKAIRKSQNTLRASAESAPWRHFLIGQSGPCSRSARSFNWSPPSAAPS